MPDLDTILGPLKAIVKGVTPPVVKKEVRDPYDPHPVGSTRFKKALEFGRRRRIGYIAADGEYKVPDEYLVKITSFRSRSTVVAPLQESINLRVESRWEPFALPELLSKGNVIIQAVTGTLGTDRRSLVTRATSRRIWQGSSPIIMALKLKFQAISDPFLEVTLPGQALQAMALPSDPSKEYAKGNPVQEIARFLNSIALRPPGPNPFSLDDVLTGRKSFVDMNENEIISSMKGGDFIMIEIGRLLTFFNVIIRESGVSFKTKFAKGGNPVEAEAEVTFETYEMMTMEGLTEAYGEYTMTEVGSST